MKDKKFTSVQHYTRVVNGKRKKVRAHLRRMPRD